MKFAAKGSQKWLQVTVTKSPSTLDRALRYCGALAGADSVQWKSPVPDDGFKECRDDEALRRLGQSPLPIHSLCDFWPRNDPVWDALGISKRGSLMLLEAKAHTPEAASPGTKASPASLKLIKKSLMATREHYAPRSKADWTDTSYQYANRLAHQYLLSVLNQLPSTLVFLYFINADDVDGPSSELEWKKTTRRIHAQLGLREDLSAFNVFNAYVDVRKIKKAL